MYRLQRRGQRREHRTDGGRADDLRATGDGAPDDLPRTGQEAVRWTEKRTQRRRRRDVCSSIAASGGRRSAGEEHRKPPGEDRDDHAETKDESSSQQLAALRERARRWQPASRHERRWCSALPRNRSFLRSVVRLARAGPVTLRPHLAMGLPFRCSPFELTSLSTTRCAPCSELSVDTFGTAGIRRSCRGCCSIGNRCMRSASPRGAPSDLTVSIP